MTTATRRTTAATANHPAQQQQQLHTNNNGIVVLAAGAAAKSTTTTTLSHHEATTYHSPLYDHLQQHEEDALPCSASETITYSRPLHSMSSPKTTSTHTKQRGTKKTHSHSKRRHSSSGKLQLPSFLRRRWVLVVVFLMILYNQFSILRRRIPPLWNIKVSLSHWIQDSFTSSSSSIRKKGNNETATTTPISLIEQLRQTVAATTAVRAAAATTRHYLPSLLEQFCFEYSQPLGFHETEWNLLQPTCHLWKNVDMTDEDERDRAAADDDTAFLLKPFKQIWDQLESQEVESSYNYEVQQQQQPVPLETMTHSLQTYYDALGEYQQLVKDFSSVKDDLRTFLRQGQSHQEVCQRVSLGKNLSDIFKTRSGDDKEDPSSPSSLLSWIIHKSQSSSSSSEAIEPLLPPLRHPKFCNPRRMGKGGTRKRFLLNLGYLIHDFEQMCKKLKPHSRIVLLDLGASLNFHDNNRDINNMPAVYLMELYRKFGFQFDHIYAFERTPTDPNSIYAEQEQQEDGETGDTTTKTKTTKTTFNNNNATGSGGPTQVGGKLPFYLYPSYHWINVGVSADPASPLNPWNLLRQEFNEDDFIVVKLDIDHAAIEVPLALQLLQNDHNDNGSSSSSNIGTLVDVFYFEHHVLLQEMTHYWRGTMEGSVGDSFELFRALRQQGIAAHSWV